MFSVKDLARSEEIYTAVLGFQVRGRGEGPSSTLERLWSLPPGTSMKWVLLAKAEVPESTQIRLVEFTPQSSRARYEYRWQDAGLNDLHFCVADIQAAYKNLKDRGFTAFHEPMLWGGGGGELGIGYRRVHECFMHGLDGEGITIKESGPVSASLKHPTTLCSASPEAPFSPVQDIVITTSSQEKSYEFYHGILGWKDIGRWEAFGPEMETMLRAPRGIVARPIFLDHPKGPVVTGIIAVETAGVEKTNLYARNAPPHRGFIVVTFKTDNLDELYRRMVAAHATIVLPPVEVAEKPYGTRAFSVRGPDGEFLEFVERNQQ